MPLVHVVLGPHLRVSGRDALEAVSFAKLGVERVSPTRGEWALRVKFCAVELFCARLLVELLLLRYSLLVK